MTDQPEVPAAETAIPEAIPDTAPTHDALAASEPAASPESAPAPIAAPAPGAAPRRSRVMPALRAAGAWGGAAGRWACAASAPREDLPGGPVRGLAHAGVVGLVIAAFLLACAGLIPHQALPLNGDEIDTAWLFSWKQYASHARPWDWGSAHSGMYNLTFWLRALAYDHGAWFRDHADEWSRVYGLGWSALMLVMVYGLGAWANGRDFGLVALMIAAFAHYNYFLSTEGNYLNETSAVYLAAIWAFLAGERTRRGWAKVLLGSLTAGLLVVAFLMYFSGRIALVGLVAYGVLRWVMNRHWPRRNALLILPIVAVAIPWGFKVRADMARDPALVKYRMTGAQILYKDNLDRAMKDYKTDSAPGAVAANVTAAFLGYQRGPNHYHSYESPGAGFLDKYSFWLFLVGAAWCCWRWRAPLPLALLLFFAMNNLVYGGLTVNPYPPKHQRVHFAIVLAYFFVSYPVWGLTRLPSRWFGGGARAAGQIAAVAALAFLAFFNSRLFWTRTWSPADPYLRTTRRNMAMADFIDQNRLTSEFIVFNQGHEQWSYDSYWCNFNPWLRQKGFRLQPWANASKAPNPGHPWDKTKGLLFLVQQPGAGVAEAEIERAAPGGRWVPMELEGRPFFRVYIAPRKGR